MNGFKRKFSGLIKKLFKKSKIEPEKFSKEIFKSTVHEFGDYTYGTPEILDWGEGAKLIVGKFCSIAANVTIFLGGNHRTDWVSTYPFNVLNTNFPNGKSVKGHPETKGNVVIGNDVWIGQGAIILSGVKIGDGAVIGAYSVVSKDVLPYSIVVGNPSKMVKKRFPEEHISNLLNIKWWDWDIKKINENIHLICQEDIERFINL